jgi:predicted PurR-regulated permease PerM
VPEIKEDMSSERVCLPRKKIIKTFVLLALASVALFLIFYLKRVFIPLGIALLIAYIVEPVLIWLDRHHTKRVYTVIAVYVILFGTLIAAGFVFGPILTAQVRDFAGYIREKGEEYDISWATFSGTGGNESTSSADADWTEESGRGSRQEDKAVQNDENAEGPGIEKTELTQAAVEAAPNQKQPIGELIKEHAQAIKSNAPSAFIRVGRSVLSGVRSAAGYLGQTVLVLFYTFFFMMHFPDIQKALLRSIPQSHELEILGLLSEIDNAVAGFFRGRLLVCVLSTVVTSTGLFISGIPYWLLLGFAAGFLGIIPVLGVVVAFIPAVAMALTSDHVMFQTIGVLLTFGAVQGVVEPLVGSLVISKEVQLHPVTVITAFLVGNALFGILGVLLAVPLAGILKILFKRFLVPMARDIVNQEET